MCITQESRPTGASHYTANTETAGEGFRRKDQEKCRM